jgi:hypothetical protein
MIISLTLSFEVSVMMYDNDRDILASLSKLDEDKLLLLLMRAKAHRVL